MPTCERCWQLKRDLDDYAELVRTNNCTPEQQAGPDANRCPHCRRMTLHQHCGACMNPDCEANAAQPQKER